MLAEANAPDLKKLLQTKRKIKFTYKAALGGSRSRVNRLEHQKFALTNEQLQTLRCSVLEGYNSGACKQQGVLFILYFQISAHPTVILVRVPEKGTEKEKLICSAYFSGELDVKQSPTTVVRAMIDHIKRRNPKFAMGCNANAHHTVWRSNINKREESLLN